MLHIEHILNGWIIGYMYYNLNKAILDIYTCVCMHECLLSCVWPFVTLWTIAHQAPLSKGFSSQEHWSRWPYISPGDLLDPRIELASLAPPAPAGRLFTTVSPGKPYTYTYLHAKSLQSCLTLCEPMNCSPPGSYVHGILQPRTLEWVAMPSSRESSQLRDQIQVS